MEIQQSKINNALVFELKGRLNSQTAVGLEHEVARMIDLGESHLVFGCAGLDYCSSAGLRVFLTAVKRLKASGGRCVFAALSPAVREVFEIAGFLEVMEIREDISQAAG